MRVRHRPAPKTCRTMQPSLPEGIIRELPQTSEKSSKFWNRAGMAIPPIMLFETMVAQKQEIFACANNLDIARTAVWATTMLIGAGILIHYPKNSPVPVNQEKQPKK